LKLLLLDNDGEAMGVDLALRAQEANHEVRYWLPTRAGDPLPYGEGLFERPEDWEDSMDWADLIVLTGNSTYEGKLAEYFGRGFPIFGANAKAAELELDREAGQQVLESVGIEVAPYQVVASPEEAIDVIRSEGKPYVMKPWGGESDKSMTCVPKCENEAIYTLEKWAREETFTGQLMLQEKIDGIEMGISGWFGPRGWSSALEESFEVKKFLVDDLGENTGEMGTIIRHVKQSKLFDMMLEPLTDYLYQINYVGDCSVNCIIDKNGQPFPLEFTMRLGWPDFCIRQEVIRGDPIEWMAALLAGEDKLRVSSAVAVGVLMCHGDFPRSKDPPLKHSGAPIYGIDEDNIEHLHFQQVMRGKAPMLEGDQIVNRTMMLTAGNYVLIAAGSGKTVRRAAENAYDVAWSVRWPGNVMMRTDIGKRLEKELPILQKHGFAVGMEW
jgi:phosphoribosylamine---glycine ligase